MAPLAPQLLPAKLVREGPCLHNGLPAGPALPLPLQTRHGAAGEACGGPRVWL